MSRAAGTIGRDLGRISTALAAMFFLSIPISLLWGEYYAIPSLVVSGLVPLAVGRSMTRRFSDADEPGKLHAMMIAATGWLLAAVFAALPFVLVAWTIALDLPYLNAPALTPTVAAFQNPLNAVFESMSGFTGTGLTMADREDVLPRTLQWWRSFTQWIGGVGVIVLTTAVLARPGSGSLTLYESEARSEKIHPSIVSTVRTIWWIFLLFTFLSIILLWLAGMPLWHAINHGMTGISTGGFSVTDGSIASYDSAAIDFALLPVMVLGAIAFPVHYLVLQGQLRTVYTDLQTRWLFGFFGVGVLGLTAMLYASRTYESLFETVRYGLFQFVSAASCTGFQTASDLGTDWSPQAHLVVSVGMFVGAAAGSTGGGIKLIRAAMLLKGTLYRISGVFYPASAVRRLKINGRSLSDTETSREFEEAAIIAVLWVVFLGAGLFVLLFTLPAGEYTLENVIFEVVSAQGNVGLSSGITGPAMPTPAKVAFLFNMWIGRLEIIPVLVLLRSVLVRSNRHS